MKSISKSIKSWKTTVISILGASVLVATQIGNILDDDPKTVFNWEITQGALVILGVGILAKDGDKS
jgi:hypothetical protein